MIFARLPRLSPSASWTCRPRRDRTRLRRSGTSATSLARASRRTRISTPLRGRARRSSSERSLFSAALLLLAARAEVESRSRSSSRSGDRAGFGHRVYNITQVSFRQAICPERMQGRMNSVMRFIVWGDDAARRAARRRARHWFGLRTALWVGAIGSSLAFLPILLSPVRDAARDAGAGRGAAAVGGRRRGRAARCRRRSRFRPHTD